MKPTISHAWNLTETEALDLQRELATRVEREDRHGPIATVAGVDVAYDKEGDRLVAAAVVLDAKTLAVIDEASIETVAQFPYVPGLFSFRELPPIAEALSKLATTPDLIVCDGHGEAHPRRFGLACHLGVLFDVPTIGCGKTLLTGTVDPLGDKRGAQAAIRDGDAVIGAALRTQDGTRPVYVSTGHRLSLQSCCEWVLALSPRYRQPETTRAADQRVRQLFRGGDGG